MSDLRRAVRRLTKAYGVELRLLVVQWSYPLLHLLTAALLWYVADAWEGARTALGTLETTIGRLSIGILSLVGLFTAGLSATRPERARASELEWTFPTGVEVTIGRWLADVTALLPFLAHPLIVAGRQGPRASLLTGIPPFVGEGALTLAFTAMGAWWLARRFSLGRWSYPLLAAGWLAFLLGPTMLVDRLPYLSLLNFMRQGTISYHSELWRRLAYGDTFRWFNLFYIGLSILVLGVLSWRETGRRFHRPSVPGGVVIAAGLTLATFAGARYVSPIVAMDAGTQSSADAQPTPAAVGATIEAYDITLDMSAGEHADFDAVMRLQNESSAAIQHLNLALHPSLQVTEASVSYAQEDGTVRLALPETLAPGERLSVQLRYVGRIWETTLEDGVPVARHFIHPRGVRLSPGLSWYPQVPGEGTSTAGGVKPHAFRLTLEGYGDLRFGANIPAAGPNVFESQDATWIYLVGSPFLVTEEIEDTTLITARDTLPQVRSMTSAYREALAHLRRFMPDVPVQGLTVMVLEPGLLPEGTPPSDGRAVIVIGRLVLYHVSDPGAYDFPLVWEALLHDLWELGGGGSGGALPWHVRQTATFIWMHHHCDGDVECLSDRIATSTEHMAPGQEQDYVPAILLDLYKEGGEASIIEILRAFRLRADEFDGMARDEVLSWLREGHDAQ